MSGQLTIDKAGRVVIPKTLRDSLGLVPGDTLEVEAKGEQITMRPVRRISPLIKEKGVWVFRTGEPLSSTITDDLLTRIREDRVDQNFGEGK